MSSDSCTQTGRKDAWKSVQRSGQRRSAEARDLRSSLTLLYFWMLRLCFWYSLPSVSRITTRPVRLRPVRPLRWRRRVGEEMPS